jgi:hypothetical protein
MEFDGSVGVDMENQDGNEQTGKIDVHDDAVIVTQDVQKRTWSEQQVQLKDGESNHRDGDGDGDGSGSQIGDDGINDVFTLLSQDKQGDDVARSGITDGRVFIPFFKTPA